MIDAMFYNTILCQTFSDCGKYLIAGNIYGEISIYDLDKILNNSDRPSTERREPSYTFTAHKGLHICSLTTTEQFVIVGTAGEISGWNLKSVMTSNSPKPSWVIKVPVHRDTLELVDVNSLWWSTADARLFAGCGDDNVYVYSLEDGQHVRTLEGHKDFIHSVHGLGNQLVTASEDGSVRLWDVREKQSTNEIWPHKKDQLARPDNGKWMGAARLSEDWLLCGGGPRLSLWYLRSLDVSTVFDLPDRGIHVASFLEDRILAAGACKHVYQFTYGADLVAKIPVDATTVYSAIHQQSPHKILSIAGSSNNIDVCTNFSYKDQVFAFA